MKPIYTLNGYRIIPHALLTMDEEYQAQRTWKERLFSRPWRPWQKMKTCIRQVPSDHAFVDEASGRIYMHPEMFARLRADYEKHNPLTQHVMDEVSSFTADMWQGLNGRLH